MGLALLCPTLQHLLSEYFSLFSYSTSNEFSFASNRYNQYDPKLHTIGTYEAVANGALLSLVSKIVQ